MKNILAPLALKISLAANTLTRFADKYGEQIPAGVATPSISFDSKPHLTLYVGSTDADRTKALTLYGDVFGRNGWTAEECFGDRNRFNWVRVIDDVWVTIVGAEILPPRERSMPVPPSKFPIQLEDAK